MLSLNKKAVFHETNDYLQVTLGISICFYILYWSQIQWNICFCCDVIMVSFVQFAHRGFVTPSGVINVFCLLKLQRWHREVISNWNEIVCLSWSDMLYRSHCQWYINVYYDINMVSFLQFTRRCLVTLSGVIYIHCLLKILRWHREVISNWKETVCLSWSDMLYRSQRQWYINVYCDVIMISFVQFTHRGLVTPSGVIYIRCVLKILRWHKQRSDFELKGDNWSILMWHTLSGPLSVVHQCLLRCNYGIVYWMDSLWSGDAILRHIVHCLVKILRWLKEVISNWKEKVCLSWSDILHRSQRQWYINVFAMQLWYRLSNWLIVVWWRHLASYISIVWLTICVGTKKWFWIARREFVFLIWPDFEPGRLRNQLSSRLTTSWSTYSVPSHYMDQCWLIGNWTIENKHQWNFYLNTNICCHEDAFEMYHAKCRPFFRPQCTERVRTTAVVSASEFYSRQLRLCGIIHITVKIEQQVWIFQNINIYPDIFENTTLLQQIVR